MHRQTLQIAAYDNAFVQVDLATSDVEFRIALPAESAANARVRVLLVLAEEATGKPAQEWRRLPSQRMFGVRNGTSGVQPLPAGTYRYQIGGRGVVAKEGDLVVTQGAPQIVNVALDPAPDDGSQQPARGGQGGPGGQGRQGPGGQGRQGGGRQPGSAGGGPQSGGGRGGD
jgi:uncharacterized membrane protein YgcG